jgi:hypothetical protein
MLLLILLNFLAIELYRLRYSTFANHQKRKIILHQTMSNIAVGSIIATTANGTKAGFDTIFHDVSIEALGAEILLSSFDVVIGFGAAQLASGFIRYQAERRKGVNEEIAKRNLQRYINQTMVEMAVFTGVGLGAMGAGEILQSIGEDAVSSLIDPTGITAAAMITYKGFKSGKSYVNKQKNKKAFELCNDIRVQHMIELAKSENQLSPSF